jgi:hypothetical protein
LGRTAVTIGWKVVLNLAPIWTQWSREISRMSRESNSGPPAGSASTSFQRIEKYASCIANWSVYLTFDLLSLLCQQYGRRQLGEISLRLMYYIGFKKKILHISVILNNSPYVWQRCEHFRPHYSGKLEISINQTSKQLINGTKLAYPAIEVIA